MVGLPLLAHKGDEEVAALGRGREHRGARERGELRVAGLGGRRGAGCLRRRLAGGSKACPPPLHHLNF